MYLAKMLLGVDRQCFLNTCLGCQLFIPRDLITPEESFTSHKRDETGNPLHSLAPLSIPPTTKTTPCAPGGSWDRPATQTLTNIPTGAEQWESQRVRNSIATVSLLLHLSAWPRNLRGPSRNLTHCSPLSSPIVGIHSARAQWVSGQTRPCCN